ncbi:TetR/AcrR family transcriptional regulator C-terminal domain-containing protein [Microtetraspora sp. NBRC 16547]|uniref:TetR/AcrR family transcriptional regulator C-terminal domain-containing protein n=1 Tax=Microtetraspora sp. NBRC 16547 TaxID=3030993 RepID=UPI0024A1576F|nr:TetR/AcrR family transcriptional regulator C-terminal domain-containing protein [Microtetraspora sp. NBRC 16547]GLX00404.1 tetracycline repressor, C-all-alpha domain protein [Microtetraspora sp. NBRC 16547]
MSRHTRPAGRPRRAILSAEAIYRAALDLIDGEGIEAFSLVRLAKALGVRMPSLYNHVDSREQVVHGVRILLAAEMDWSPLGRLTWDQVLAEWARSYRAVFAEHPNTVKLLATTPVRTSEVLDQYELVVASLEDAGWRSDQVIWILTTLEAFILGSALDLAAPEEMIDLSADATRHPRLAAAVQATPTSGRADSAFELGLVALLAGLRAQLGGRTHDHEGEAGRAVPG